MNLHFLLYSLKKQLFNAILMKKNKNIIKKNLVFQNSNNGKKCFVIGNGPSLQIKDLERAERKGFYTFASNGIYNFFENTVWRPSYYAVSDEKFYKDNRKIIDCLELKNKFLPIDLKDNENIDKNYYYFGRKWKIFRKEPVCEGNITKSLGEGNTITYFLIQLAICMGFQEIYLIGCDFNYSSGIDSNGNKIEEQNINNYPWGKGILYNTPDLKSNFFAFKAAKKYCDFHGIVIKNVTRGGKLEVFERYDVDDLL